METNKSVPPGGYAIVYVFADGEEICAPCANRLLVERADHIGTDLANGTEIADYGRHHIGGTYFYDRSEEIAGFYSMDQTDTCGTCVECGKYVLASGCRAIEDTDGTYADTYAVRADHGEYCSLFDPETHTHTFGNVELSRFAGTAHRKCTHPQCSHVSLDLTEEED